jgi:DNA polymerase elongation subunit (family B)
MFQEFALRGDNPVKSPNNKSNLKIQIIDWYADNLEDNSDNDEPDEVNKKKSKDKKFMIKAYGSTIKGTSVCINISGYPPHFYIEIPNGWEYAKAKMFVETIQNDKSFPDYLKNSIKEFIIVQRKKFKGFTNDKLFKFIQISFNNTSALYSFNKVITKLNKEGGIKFPGHYKKYKHDIYESNIPPLLRFFHRHELSPAGWIELGAGKYDVNFKKESMTQLEINIEWNNIEMIESTDMAPFIIASYDIEADSSHGDFPLPIKTYKKFATENIQSYYKNKLDSEKEVQKVEQKLYNYIKVAFKNGDDEISKVFTKRNIKPNEAKIKICARKIRKVISQKETYKIMIVDILSNYHLDNNIDQETYEINLENSKTIFKFIKDAFCDEDTSKETFNINKIYTKQNNKPPQSLITNLSKKMMTCYSKFIDSVDEEHLEILFDVLAQYYKIYSIEQKDKIDYLYTKLKQNYVCDEYKDTLKNIISGFISNINTTINQFMSIIDDRLPEMDVSNETKIKRCDTIFIDMFPPVEGDKVIQIGTTVQRYGEKNCFIKHIVTLDTCSKIDGTIVEQCTNERDVLIKWTEFIQKLDPDIITGYNIFGFDYAYMYNRAKELGCIEEFSKLSRIRDKESGLIEKTLSSSALGENKLTYIQMEGRVQLDLFKIIQRDHNLVSYKLDNVAETFINDSIIDIKWHPKSNTTLMKIKGIINLNNGNFITINIKNEKYRDGKKLKIINIDYESGVIIVNENILEGIEALNIEYNEKVKCEWKLAKDDVTPNDIFRYQKQGPDERRIVAVYCIQDCALCLHIINKLQIVTNNIAMANVCCVPLSFIFLRGQGIKILSLVSRRCKKENYLIPVIKYEQEEKYTRFAVNKDYKQQFEYGDEADMEVKEDDGYEGAIVLKPHPGIYLKQYTVILDYASLYPSSMISENLCHTSIILPEDKQYLGDKGAEELKKLGYGYVDISYDIYKWVDPKVKSKGKMKTGIKTCRFVQLPNGKKSIIPNILQDLLSARKMTKKQMKNETDEFQKSVLDGLQLAYKVTANSVYGQIGASTSAICLKDIAASTTATGRKLLYLAKDKIEEKFEGAKAIYGDSVLGDTPLLLKNIKENRIEIKTIKDVDNPWTTYDNFKMGDSNRKDKQQTNSDYMIYTSSGWSKINRVIRHKTEKKIYRVTTHTGTADVTEDHSLLDSNNNIVKPTVVNIGTSLLHNYPNFKPSNITLKDIMDYIDNIHTKSIREKRAFIYGFFFGDGSCGRYNSKYGVKYMWAINNQNYKLCSIIQNLCIDVFESNFKINNTLESSGVYKIVPKGNIKYFVDMFRDICYSDKYKIIPTEFMNEEYNVRFAYISGYYAAVGYKCENQNTKNIVLSNKGKIGTSMLYYMFKSLGLNVSINTRKDKMDIYKLTITKNKLRKDPNKIKKIDYIKTISDDEYVYDIETETGNFNTGFELIVKNTDSVFIDFSPKDEHGNAMTGKEGLKRAIDLGVEAEKYVQGFLKPPHKLEYEKTFWPFILFSKKRYIGYKYEFDIDNYKETSMGIVLKRRDNANIVKHTYGSVIDIILKEQNLSKSITTLQNQLMDLLDGKYPLDMLIISKSLRGYYKNPLGQPHKVLADRMGKRDPGNKPMVNDRIPFVYIQTKERKNVKILQGDRVEHPDYIKENNIRPDYKFYITNQILKPICQIYALISEQLDGFKHEPNYYNKRYEFLKKTVGHTKALEKVNDLRFKDASEIVFGEVLRVAENRKNRTHEITDFFKITKNKL